MSCDPCGFSASYSEAVSFDASGIAMRVITTSGCPNHYSYCTGKEGEAGCGGVGEEGSASQALQRAKQLAVPARPVLIVKARPPRDLP